MGGGCHGGIHQNSARAIEGIAHQPSQDTATDFDDPEEDSIVTSCFQTESISFRSNFSCRFLGKKIVINYTRIIELLTTDTFKKKIILTLIFKI